MCQVTLGVKQPRQAAECIGFCAVAVVTGWELGHVVAVSWSAPKQLAEEFFMVGLGLALIIGVALVHLQNMASALPKATTVANSYHGSPIRRCNEAKLIVKALDAHESLNGIAEVWKALQKVQEAAVAAEEAFTAVLLRVTKDEEVGMFKDRAEKVSNTTADTAAMCLGDRRTEARGIEARGTEARGTEAMGD